MKALMTSIGLMERVETEVKTMIEEMRLQANHGEELKVPTVHFQYLPPKQSRAKEKLDPDFPHVIVRYISEKKKGGHNVVTLRLIAGVHNEDPQTGIRDLLNILTRIKIGFEQKQFVGPFRLKDIELDVPEEQYIPEWFGLMTLEFNTPTIQTEGGIGLDY